MDNENKIVVALKGIVLYAGKLLIVKRSSNDEVDADAWEFPGGKLEFGEKLEDGLRREIKEEVGVNADVDRLLYATEFKTDPCRQVVVLCYLCYSNSSAVTLSEEHSGYLWVTLTELKERLAKAILDDLHVSKVFDIIHEVLR